MDVNSAELVGQDGILRPIVNRPHDYRENFGVKTPHFLVATFHSRRLPHLHSVGQPTFLTWRLDGSLPAGRSFPAAGSSGRAFLAIDRVLDTASTGPLFLRMTEVARVVVDAIRYRDQQAYQLHAFVVMPNHVHILITPLEEVSKVMHSLKRFTAREANLLLGRTGQPFWQDESYDRLVRDDSEFERIAGYIERNPVTAGLATMLEAFLWSSARPIDNRPQVDNLPH